MYHILCKIMAHEDTHGEVVFDIGVNFLLHYLNYNLTNLRNIWMRLTGIHHVY